MGWSLWLQLVTTSTCASSGCRSTALPYSTVHRLVDHCSPADDRVLLDPVCGAAQPRQGMFFRLLIGTVAMLAFGYAGEAGFLPAFVGFVLGMAGWGFILFEIFSGEAGTVCASGDGVNKYVKESFNTMGFIVSVGWSIYPLGYFFGYLMGAVEDSTLNLVYNLADFVNKIAFCLAIWNSAKNSTLESKMGLREALLP